MVRLYQVIVLLICFQKGMSQTNDSIASKREAEKKMNKKSFDFIFYSKSKVNNAEFQEKILENSEIKESVINEFKINEIMQQNDQKGIIENPKEREKQIVVLTTVISKNENKKYLTSKAAIGSKLEKNNKRLSGPSQFDSRIEPLQLNPEITWQNNLLNSTFSVGMIVEKERLTSISNDLYQLDILSTLGSKFNLCPEEAFFNQPVVGIGTAWLFSSQSMITALHVLERPLKYYVVVFGYQIINKNGAVNSFIPKSEVYEITSIIKKNEELDIAEIQLNRPSDRKPLEVENIIFNSNLNNEIYMIGHPNGLPMKLALNASVEENKHPFYFYTSLDSFQGNSGSPVFNFYTNKVIGVLVSGEIDYKYNGNCYYSPLCKVPYCKGEKVIRIEEIINQF